MRLAGYRFEPSPWPTVAVVALLPLLLWLGFWQLGRAESKERLLAESHTHLGMPPLDLDASTEARPEPWRRADATGRYAGARQYLLDNRTREGIAGYHVLTVLERGSSRRAVLVNRGWVPVGASRERLPPIPAPDGAVVVTGRAAAPPATGLLLGASGYGAGAWPRVVQRVELETMERELGVALEPFLVLLAPDAPHGFVREWRPVHGIGPDRHRAYAFQWFALALTLAVLYVVVNTRRAHGD